VSRSMQLPLRALGVVLSLGLVAVSSILTATAAQAATPVPVLASISAGGSHTCALTTSGGVKCWGDNQYGELGDGTNTNSMLPVDVAGLSTGVSAISVSDLYSCALTTAGDVKCWGYNGDGELGDGTHANSDVPVDVAGLGSGVQSISAGGRQVCVVTSAGGAKCWGAVFLGGYSNVPIDVAGLTSGVAAVSAGYEHACAVTTAGAALCWGAGYWGQLGTGQTTNSSGPVAVSGLSSGVASISAGKYNTTCAVTTSGGAKCWGFNLYGALGVGSGGPDLCGAAPGTPCSKVPVDVSGLSSGVSSISVGYEDVCAVTTSGGAKCWGTDTLGQLGDGSLYGTVGYPCDCTPTPVDVTGLTSGVSGISLGHDFACAVTVSGDGDCWGNNRNGQLGDGTTTNRSLPVSLFSPFIAGITSSLAKINPDGTVSITTAWNGLDPYAHITSFEARYQTNGRPWHDIALAHPLATHFTIPLTQSKARYTFQIRATDALGRVGAWSPGISFAPGTAQETSAQFSSGWTYQTGPQFWGGTTARVHRPGAEAMFTFHGGGVDWIGGVGPSYGSADVYMDGVYVTTVDCHAVGGAHRKVLFRGERFGYGAHTIEIFGHGRIEVDGFFWFSQ
jgi:alpha-tubulin suppressor-like RCC1 family protein